MKKTVSHSNFETKKQLNHNTPAFKIAEKVSMPISIPNDCILENKKCAAKQLASVENTDIYLAQTANSIYMKSMLVILQKVLLSLI